MIARNWGAGASSSAVQDAENALKFKPDHPQARQVMEAARKAIQEDQANSVSPRVAFAKNA